MCRPVTLCKLSGSSQPRLAATRTRDICGLGILLLGACLLAWVPRPATAAPGSPLSTMTESNLPLLTIREFLDGAPHWAETVRVRMRGTVTHSVSDKTYFIQAGDAAVYVFHKPDQAFRPGDIVEVTGSPSGGHLLPTLQRCEAIAIGRGPLPEPPLIPGAGALDRRNAMKLVRLRGRLQETNLMQGRLLVLRPEDGSQAIQVNLEALADADPLPRLRPGSLLEVTGVLSLRARPNRQPTEADRQPAGAMLLVRTNADLVEMGGPPFWPAETTWRTLAWMGAALALALAWVWSLRRQVRRQTAMVERRFEREAALRASEDRFAKVFRASPDPVIIARASDERVLDVNPAFERLTGYRPAEVTEQPLSTVWSGKAPQLGAQAAQALREGGSLTNFDCILRTKSGKALQCLGSAEPIELNGEHCWLAVFRDVTDRHEAEQQQRKLQARLQQAQKMESLGTLAGGIAHDFNNLLGAILGNVDLLKHDLGAPGPAEASLGEIRNASLRARDLVKQILAFSRQQPLQRRALQLEATVLEAVNLLRATIPASMEIHTAIDPACPAVFADPSQIHQLVMNLGTNAWHAMEGRPGRLTIGLRAAQVDAALARKHPDLRAGRYACLSVTDQGVGMDAATYQRIFDPFFTTKSPGKGTGLGLAVVHGIVKDSDGAIVVESEPGQGTTFTVYLPAVISTTPVADPGATHGELIRGRGEHVLIVDDDGALVSVGCRMLERLGYQATGCTSATEALALFAANPASFFAALVDLAMPGTTGLEVIRQLRAIRPDLTLVLVSGFITDDIRAQALACGASATIHKPVTAEELAEILHRLLRTRDAAEGPNCRNGSTAPTGGGSKPGYGPSQPFGLPQVEVKA